MPDGTKEECPFQKGFIIRILHNLVNALRNKFSRLSENYDHISKQ